MVTVDAKWLLSHLDDPSVVILDARGLMPYGLGHVKNAKPVNIEQLIFVDDNGSNLVIGLQTAERVFSELGIDGSKTVVVYGEYPDPSAARIVWTLVYYGHEDAKLLDVGYLQWKKGGFPTTTHSAASAGYDNATISDPKKNPQLTIMHGLWQKLTPQQGLMHN
jgi:thiosulfate/3-mercaptopyruvate sulfurtransferase